MRQFSTIIFALLVWLMSHQWSLLSFNDEPWFSSFSLVGSLPVAFLSAALFYYAYPKRPLYRYLWIGNTVLTALFIMYCTWELGSPLGFIGGLVAFPILYVIAYQGAARWRLAQHQGYWFPPGFHISQWSKSLLHESIKSAFYVLALFVVIVLIILSLNQLGLSVDSIVVQFTLLAMVMSVLSYLQLKRILEAIVALSILGFLIYTFRYLIL